MPLSAFLFVLILGVVVGALPSSLTTTLWCREELMRIQVSGCPATLKEIRA